MGALGSGSIGLGLALGIAMKFCTSKAKRLKLNV